MDAAVSGADKQCGCLGCAALELESAKKELTDKGWLAKVNAVLGRHGLVADLEYAERRRDNGPQGGPHALEAHTECSYGNTIEVSHAESLLRSGPWRKSWISCHEAWSKSGRLAQATSSWSVAVAAG